MTPESRVKMFIDRNMKNWFPGAIKYSPPGVGMFGRNGMPDRMWYIEAVPSNVVVVVAIEAKAEDGVLTILQRNMLTKMRDIGIIAAVVRGKDIRKLEAIRDEILRRIRMANEKQESCPVRASETDS
jgi:hypothetical protein